MSTVVIPAWWLDPAWLPQGSSEPQDSAGSRQRLGELSSGHAVRPRAPAVLSRETKGQVIKCHGYEVGLSEDWNGQCDQAVRAGGGGRARQAGAGPVGQVSAAEALGSCKPATTRSGLHLLNVPLVVRCRMVQGWKNWNWELHQETRGAVQVRGEETGTGAASRTQ